jgi:outer membrane receptor protein involved in Fe transport
LQGGLFELPAGTLRFALGASYREMDYQFLNDTLTTQGRSYLDQALGIYPSGDSQRLHRRQGTLRRVADPGHRGRSVHPGSSTWKSGGRMSKYSTTGTSYTYKILGDWSVNDWLRFRGGYNRAERAPNIGELFLKSQQTFGFNGAGDVCSTLNPQVYSANPAQNPTAARAVQGVCRALMQQAAPTQSCSTTAPVRRRSLPQGRASPS